MFSIKYQIGLILALLITLNAHGKDEKPLWTKTPPKPTAEYIFIVGIGESDDFAAAKQEAEKDIKLQLIELALGAATVISQKTTADTYTTEIKENASIDTDIIFIKGLETEAIYEEEKEDLVTKIYILKKVSHSEIEQLKKKYQKSANESIDLTDVTIKTDIPSAKVFVDGKFRGTTPVDLTLKSGTYNLVIEKNGYKDVQKKLMVERGTPLILQITLETQVGEIVIKTTTPKAKIFFRNLSETAEPNQKYAIPIGKHKMEVTADGYDTYFQDIDILPNQKLVLDVQLVKAKMNSYESRLKKFFELRANEKLKEAMELGEALYSEDTSNYALAAIIGHIYYDLKNKEAALKWYKISSSIAKKHPKILRYQCELQFQLFEFEAALDSCKEAKNLDPSDAVTHVYLGKIYERLAKNPYFEEKYKSFAEQSYEAAGSYKSEFKVFLYDFCTKEAKRFGFKCKATKF